MTADREAQRNWTHFGYGLAVFLALDAAAHRPVAGVLVVCTAPLLPPAAVALAWVAGLPAWGIALIAHVAAALPYGSLPWLPGWPGVVTLVLAILLALTTAPWWLHQLTRRRWSAGAAGITALEDPEAARDDEAVPRAQQRRGERRRAQHDLLLAVRRHPGDPVDPDRPGRQVGHMQRP